MKGRGGYLLSLRVSDWSITAVARDGRTALQFPFQSAGRLRSPGKPSTHFFSRVSLRSVRGKRG